MNIELMREFPPTPERLVTLANWRKPPFNKWSFMHVREIVPSADIPNRPEAVAELPRGDSDLARLHIDVGGSERSLSEFLQATDTDGLVVLHKGKLVHEYYGPRMSASTPHIFMSVSKSILGLLVGILVDRGIFEVGQPVTDFVPEVAGTAYARATIRDLLDMRANVKFDEDYTATSGLIIEYRKAQNWDPLAPGESPSDLRSFFSQLTEIDGGLGGNFHYVSPNTDLLGWVIERAAAKRYADLVSDLLWQPMGAGHNAYITVDRFGAPRCAGGFCSTTRDLARVGQLLVNRGRAAGRQVVPAAWIDDILIGGDRTAWDAGDFAKYFPKMPVHYRSKWYVLRGSTPMIFAVGVHGQNLFADPEKELVISKFSSQAVAMDEQRIMLTMQWVEAVREHLG